MQWVLLCQLNELALGQARGFDPFNKGLDSLFLIKLADRVLAYRDVCPHYGTTTLPWQKDAYLDASGQHIVCAAHGALFDLRTAECISGPCLGEALEAIRLDIQPDGNIWALLEPENNNDGMY
jgi:nitrite reductase/ring-hydroxylating ferredoxin subunit